MNNIFVLDRYEYHVTTLTEDGQEKVLVSIKVDSPNAVEVADISTILNHCDGHCFVEGLYFDVDVTDGLNVIGGDPNWFLTLEGILKGGY